MENAWDNLNSCNLLIWNGTVGYIKISELCLFKLNKKYNNLWGIEVNNYREEYNLELLFDLVKEITNFYDKYYNELEKARSQMFIYDLNKMSSDLQETLNRKNYGILTEEDSKELKRIYRKLIKKLHPDLNKESNEKDKNLLLQVTHAYENGDLNTLKNLELLTDEMIDKENIEIGKVEELKQSKLKYEMIVKDLLETIKKIKESFPYNKKEFLGNDILIQKRKDELHNEMKMCKEIYLNLDNILNNLKGEIDG